MRQAVKANTGAIAVDLIGLARPIGDTARQLHLVIARFGLHGGDDAVHRIDAVKVIGGHDYRAVGMLQGRCKTTANHIAQNVKDHHIGVIQQMVLLQQLDRLPHHIAAAAGARRRPAGLDAFHAVKAGGDIILRPQLFGVKIHLFQDVDHGGLQPPR